MPSWREPLLPLGLLYITAGPYHYISSSEHHPHNNQTRAFHHVVIFFPSIFLAGMCVDGKLFFLSLFFFMEGARGGEGWSGCHLLSNSCKKREAFIRRICMWFWHVNASFPLITARVSVSLRCLQTVAEAHPKSRNKEYSSWCFSSGMP